MDDLVDLDELLAFSDPEPDSPILESSPNLDSVTGAPLGNCFRLDHSGLNDVDEDFEQVSPRTPPRVPGQYPPPPSTPTPVRIIQLMPVESPPSDDDGAVTTPTPLCPSLPTGESASGGTQTPHTPHHDLETHPSPLPIVNLGDGVRIIGADSSDPGVMYTSPATQRVRKIDQRDEHENDDDADNESESPVRIIQETRKAVVRRKAAKKRKQTLQARQQERDAERAAVGQAAVAANEDMISRAARQAERMREACFVAVLDTLKQNNQTWGNFVEWLSHPASKRAQERFDGLFKNRSRDSSTDDVQSQVGRILDLWATQNSKTGRGDVHAWAMHYVCRVVNREATRVSREGILLTRPDAMTDSFLLSFDLSSIHERIRTLCPSTTELLRHLTTTRRQRKKEEVMPQTTEEQETAERRERKKLTVFFHMS